MGKSLSSDSARGRSEKQQEEASRRAAPDARERIPTGASGALDPIIFYCIPTIQSSFGHRARPCPFKIRGRGAALAVPDQKATAQRARKTTRFRRAG